LEELPRSSDIGRHQPDDELGQRQDSHFRRILAMPTRDIGALPFIHGLQITAQPHAAHAGRGDNESTSGCSRASATTASSLWDKAMKALDLVRPEFRERRCSIVDMIALRKKLLAPHPLNCTTLSDYSMFSRTPLRFRQIRPPGGIWLE
jgi:hypothetical protein